MPLIPGCGAHEHAHVPARYLVALAEHRHFARAAQACHITQPALSHALRALENEFGTPIVKRVRSYAGLTPEGELVLGTARRMLHAHALLQQELASRAGQPKGRLQLGVVPTAVPMAARFAALLQATHPGISPLVRAMRSHGIEESLADLSLDLALGFTGRLVKGGLFAVLPQYGEHNFLVRRAQGSNRAPKASLRLGAPMGAGKKPRGSHCACWRPRWTTAAWSTRHLPRPARWLRRQWKPIPC